MNQDQQRRTTISLGEIISLLCCPPCPSSIASKLAFSPPARTYSFEPVSDNDSTTTTTAASTTNSNPDVSSSTPTNANATTTCPTSRTKANKSNNNNIGQKYLLKLDDRAEWQFSQKDLNNFDVFYAQGGRNKKIACMYVKATVDPKFTILFSHGNAADLGLMSSFYLGLGTKIDCNIFGYDYSGYGLSTGKPSEKNLYSDIEIAWNGLRRRYNVPSNKIILYGQSIGTVSTVDLASKYDFGGVILHSPLTSGVRLAFPNTKRTWFFDAFTNIDKIPKINSPLLVIHGTEDEVIDISHGNAIHSLARKPVDPLWVEGAGHNDIELFREYLERLKRFINTDLQRTS